MKPILFNTEMVRAIFDGRKTVTRRILKLDLGQADIDKNDKDYFYLPDKDGEYIHVTEFAPYKIGDVLYVRETFNDTETNTILYAADKEFIDFGCKKVDGFLFMESDIKWKPSIHMPKEAARIFLKVTDVRVEQLQDMKHEDPMKEGIRSFTKDGTVHKFAPSDGWMPWSEMPRNPIKAFELLWNSTIKKTDLDQYSWDANPWVWVIEFEKCESEEIK
jgi:hypothetical protein